jgi:hypothetical protein
LRLENRPWVVLVALAHLLAEDEVVRIWVRLGDVLGIGRLDLLRDLGRAGLAPDLLQRGAVGVGLVVAEVPEGLPGGAGEAVHHTVEVPPDLLHGLRLEVELALGARRVDEDHIVLRVPHR